MNNTKYYNDNLAYDFDLFLPKNKNDDDKIIRTRPQKKRASKRAAKAINNKIASFAAVGFVLCGIFAGIFMRARITEVTRDIATTKTEITKLESKSTELYVQLENKISYKNIEEAAKALGMKKMDSNQVVYIRLNDDNKASNSNGDLSADKN